MLHFAVGKLNIPSAMGEEPDKKTRDLRKAGQDKDY